VSSSVRITGRGDRERERAVNTHVTLIYFSHSLTLLSHSYPLNTRSLHFICLFLQLFTNFAFLCELDSKLNNYFHPLAKGKKQRPYTKWLCHGTAVIWCLYLLSNSFIEQAMGNDHVVQVPLLVRLTSCLSILIGAQFGPLLRSL
jgi:hypothetical protein